MTQPRMFQSDAETDDQVTFMVTVLDFQDAAPSIRRLQDWALISPSRSRASWWSMSAAAPGR